MKAPWYFGDAPAGQCRLDDHLARELHARGAQTQLQRRRAIDTAQATMEVTDAGGEKEAPGKAQHRIAEITMQERHGARPNAAAKAVADDHRVAGAQTIDERVEL